MNILITGAGGFIGQHLLQDLRQSESRRDLIPLGSPRSVDSDLISIDITNRVNFSALVQEHAPDVVVHLAGNKNLGQCEREPEAVRAVNLEATETLCDAISDKCRLIFLSSDYVFDGERGDYCESDVPAPKTVYGRMKFESEQMIAARCTRYTIVRTGGVYGIGGRFFDWILNSLEAGDSVEAFTDTRFTPTYIGDLLRVIRRVLDRDENELLHVAGPTSISRYEMACAVARHLGADESRVVGASVRDTGLLIPADNSLSSEWTRQRLGEKFTTVLEGISLVLGKS